MFIGVLCEGDDESVHFTVSSVDLQIALLGLHKFNLFCSKYKAELLKGKPHS